ncbi:MAG: hypothetical protein HOP30_18325 [Cyclobacteriaceae bacterium]|nr:hypothetical protein [Cyclobacteriaceae bacterium]
MISKFEIEQRISDNARQRKLTPGIDKLEPLVPVKISPDFLEADAFSELRISWFKKWPFLAVALFLIVAIFQMVAHLDIYQYRNLFILVSSILTTCWVIWKFVDNRVILKITPEGLTVFPSVFNRWQDIEYLYFHTNDESDDSDGRIYLVINSKSCQDYKINVGELAWPVEKLGRTLYQCMRKYKK